MTARLDRQKLLRDRPNTAFSFIVDEHVFLRRTGGADVTRELLDHVLETARASGMSSCKSCRWRGAFMRG